MVDDEPPSVIGSPLSMRSEKALSFIKPIEEGVRDTLTLMEKVALPSEQEALKGLGPIWQSPVDDRVQVEKTRVTESGITANDLLVSFRASFSNLAISFVDAGPSEIAVATFKNVNAIASWDVERLTDSMIFITISSLQIDNMVPNSPFPVAVCPLDEQDSNKNMDLINLVSQADTPPLLVIGLSFAPKHKTGIVVRAQFCRLSMWKMTRYLTISNHRNNFGRSV
jgi:hypothetical protein